MFRHGLRTTGVLLGSGDPQNGAYIAQSKTNKALEQLYRNKISNCKNSSSIILGLV